MFGDAVESQLTLSMPKQLVATKIAVWTMVRLLQLLFIDIIDLLISTDSVTTGSDSGDKVRVDNHTCGNEPRRALAFDSQKISLRLHHCSKPSGYFNFDCGLNRPIFR